MAAPLRTASRTLVSVLAAVALFATACSAAPTDEGGATDDALSSSESVRLYAKDDATRIACRAVTNRTFCSTKEAIAKARECTGDDVAVEDRFSMEVTEATCAKSDEIYPTIASCNKPITMHCAFYSACVDRAIPCGEEGYALGFGERFCSLSRSAKFGEKGEAWAVGVIGCLQRSLVPRVVKAGAFRSTPESAATCNALFEEAFASHPACYTHPDHSICFLPASDLKTILETIGAEELFKARTGVQIAQTLKLCAGQVAHAIGRHLFGGRAGDASSASELSALRERERLLEELTRKYDAP